MRKHICKTIKLLAALSILALGISVGIAAYAQDDIIGAAYATDIGAIIDGSPIASYNINGSTYVIAEELRSYGFDVTWDGDAFTLTIEKNDGMPLSLLEADGINVRKDNISVGRKMYDVYSTDIVTFINGQSADAAFINGQMLIKLRDLGVYGDVSFDEESRVASLETIKAGLLKEFEEAADKQTLDLGYGQIYEGQVEDGEPNGIGKITSTQKMETGEYGYEFDYGHGSVRAPILTRVGETVEKTYTVTQIGHFDNRLGSNNKRGYFYTEGYIPSRFSKGDQSAECDIHNAAEAMGYIDLLKVELITRESYTIDECAYIALNYLYGNVETDHICPKWNCASMGGAARFGASAAMTSPYIKNIPFEDPSINNLTFNVKYNKTTSQNIEYYSIKSNDYLYGYKIVAPKGNIVVPDNNVKFSEFVQGGIVSDNNELYVPNFIGYSGYCYSRRNAIAYARNNDRKCKVVLARDGKVWKINNEYDDSKDELLLENIKSISVAHYLDNDGNLYYTNYQDKHEKIAENVSELRSIESSNGGVYYLTNDNRLYRVDRDSAEFVKDEIKSFDTNWSYTAYIKNNGEVYFTDMYGDREVIYIGAGGVQVSQGRRTISYINGNGELFVYYKTDYGYTPYWLSRGDHTEKVTDDVADVESGDGAILVLKNNKEAWLYTRLQKEPINVGVDIVAINDFQMLADDGSLWRVYNSSDDIKRYGYIKQIYPGKIINLSEDN